MELCVFTARESRTESLQLFFFSFFHVAENVTKAIFHTCVFVLVRVLL